MKKLTVAFASLSIALAGFTGFTTVKAVDTIKEVKPVIHEASQYTTEYVVVQSKADKGYLNSQPIQKDTNCNYGYLLDDKYQLGDVVEITYRNDDLKAEHKVTGSELEEVEAKYGSVINSILEDGIREHGMFEEPQQDLTTNILKVTSIDNEYADAIDNYGNSYVIIKDGLAVGDTVQVQENQYSEVVEQQKIPTDI